MATFEPGHARNVWEDFATTRMIELLFATASTVAACMVLSWTDFAWRYCLDTLAIPGP